MGPVSLGGIEFHPDEGVGDPDTGGMGGRDHIQPNTLALMHRLISEIMIVKRLIVLVVLMDTPSTEAASVDRPYSSSNPRPTQQESSHP